MHEDEVILNRRVQYSVHVTFDESSFPSLSQVESSSEDDNIVIDPCSYESFDSENKEYDGIGVDISALREDSNDASSSQLHDVSVEATTLTSLSWHDDIFQPALSSRPHRNHNKPNC